MLSRSPNLNQLGLEDYPRLSAECPVHTILGVGLTQSCVGRDDTGSARSTVAESRVNCELALLANSHVEEALVPALDDLASADLEVEGLATIVGRIELLAVGQGAPVVDGDVVACSTD